MVDDEEEDDVDAINVVGVTVDEEGERLVDASSQSGAELRSSKVATELTSSAGNEEDDDDSIDVANETSAVCGAASVADKEEEDDDEEGTEVGTIEVAESDSDIDEDSVVANDVGSIDDRRRLRLFRRP